MFRHPISTLLTSFRRSFPSYTKSKLHAPICGRTDAELESTVLDNQLAVYTMNTGAPYAHLAIAFKAGPRYERYENKGITHMLRICHGLSTLNYTRFSIMRNVQEGACSLSWVGDREVIMYVLQGPRDGVEDLSCFLADVACNPVFLRHEVDEVWQRVRTEMADRPADFKARDFFYRAAFRHGIGHSIYMPKDKIGHLTCEQLGEFVCKHYKSDNAVVMALGLEHDDVVEFSKSLNLEEGFEGPETPNQFYGGQVRSDCLGDWCYVVLGVEGASRSNIRKAVTLACVRKAFGTGPVAKPWGYSTSGLLRKNFGDDCYDMDMMTFSNGYSDVGVFGFFIACHPLTAPACIETALKTLRGGLEPKDAERGRTQFLQKILSSGEALDDRLYWMTLWATIGEKAMTSQAMAEVVEDLSVDEIIAAADELKGKKLAIAAVGDIREVPYLDDLC